MEPTLLHGELKIDFSQSDRFYEEIKARLIAPGPDQEAAELERLLHTQGLELLRLLLEARLNIVTESPPQSAPVNALNQALTHQRNKPRQLTTLFGDITLQRQGRAYFEHGVVYPCDAHLNLPNLQYSYEVQKQLTSIATEVSFEAAQARLKEQTAAHVPLRQTKVIVQEAVADVEAFGKRPVEDENTTDPLVMSYDHTGVVMREEDLKAATAERAQKNKTQRLNKTRFNRGQPHGHKRMACVAGIYSQKPTPRTAQDVVYGLKGAELVLGTAAKPPPILDKPRNKRVQASLKKTTTQVMEDTFRQAQQRDPTLARDWIALMDGSLDLARNVKAQAAALGKEVTLILDFIHVLQYLWRAADALYGSTSEETEPWVLERLLKILQGQVSQVAAGIRSSATKREISGTAREKLDECANYMLSHKEMMKYDKYLAAGWPIATGVIEGTCRHLVKDRMDLTGARWRLSSAEAVLQVRALRINEQWEEYWKFHEERCKQQRFAGLYLNGAIPSLVIHLDNPTHLKTNL